VLNQAKQIAALNINCVARAKPLCSPRVGIELYREGCKRKFAIVFRRARCWVGKLLFEWLAHFELQLGSLFQHTPATLLKTDRVLRTNCETVLKLLIFVFCALEIIKLVRIKVNETKSRLTFRLKVNYLSNFFAIKSEFLQFRQVKNLIYRVLPKISTTSPLN